MPMLSFVIPVYNEADSLSQLIQEIHKESSKLTLSYEILIINDGSSDKTIQIVKSLKIENPNIFLYSFQKNFGKANALSLGFEKAKGEVVFTLDGDLQDDPGEIKKFLDKLDEGYDMVSGWKERRLDPLEKRLPSKLFNLVVSFFSGVKLHDFNCGFKAYRKHVVEEIRLTGEMHRYIPVLASLKGFTVGEISVHHRARIHGKSKYGIGRYFKGFWIL
jgi:glycosyltransferase involved in cell wall biosynthesis